MAEDYLKKLAAPIVLVILIVLSFLLLKPILMSIIAGIILAYIFSPVYKKISKITKLKNISAILICAFLIFVIIIPFWFLIPIVIEQSIKIYFASQQIDFMTPLQQLFPSLFSSPEFTSEMSGIIHSFVTKITSSLMNGLSQLLVNFPTLFAIS